MPTSITNTSNTVQTVVSHAEISNDDGGLVKSLDKLFADVGEEIKYTILLKNTGNTAANNIVFTDIIPNATTLVQNSVMLNGITQAGANPQNGITVGTLGPGAKAKIEFKVTVVTIPNPNIVENIGQVRYTYTADPANPNGELVANDTNTVITVINSGQLSDIQKQADKQFADIGDEILYTISASNVGNVVLNDVIVLDTIPNGTKFIDGSISVNGIAQFGNIQDGINIGAIAVGDILTTTFKVVIVTVPNPNPIDNRSRMKYIYTVDPDKPNDRSGEKISSVANTQVNSAKILLVKSVDNVYVDIADQFTYSIAVKNIGNVDAKNILVSDTIPNGTSLVDGSININGITQFGAHPETGIYIDTIKPGTVTTVDFRVMVHTLPKPNMIPNQAIASYTYVTDPNSIIMTSYTEVSNSIFNVVNNGDFYIQKYADKCFASVNDEIIYTLEMLNIGNVSLNSVVVYDEIPIGTAIVPGSIKVNGVQQLGGSLSNGVGVGTIAIAEKAKVTFKVKVVQLVPNLILQNFFEAVANYTKDPLQQNGAKKQKKSNVVTVELRDAIIGAGPNSFIKTVDKEFVGIREVVTYTIILENKGNISGSNVTLKDIIPLCTSFVEDSVEINGTIIPGASPAQGIVLGTINPGDKIIIKFKVHIDEIPNPNVVRNQAAVTYNYTKNPGYVDCEFVTGTSNETQVIVNHGEVLEGLVPESCGFTMLADKCYARRGETISYNCNIPNSGNVAIENVEFSACIPNGTILIEDSVVINGGIILGADPEIGLKIGRINTGDVASVYFKVEVVSIPKLEVATNQATVCYQYYINPVGEATKAKSNSNFLTIPLGDAMIDKSDGGFIKCVDRQFVQLGDIVNHTVALKNTGNMEASEIIVIDSFGKGNKLVPGSVSINNVLYNSIDPNRGITLLSLNSNEITTITFKSIIDTIPKNGKIKSSAIIDYIYRYKNENPIKARGTSNEVIINVRSVNVASNNFNGSCDCEFAAVGDIITYTYDIINTGNITAENVLFKAKIEEGTVFVEDSVLVNNYQSVGAYLDKGIYIGGVQPGYPQKVSYQVKVLYIPRRNPIGVSAILCYESRVDERCLPVPGTVQSNLITTEIKTPDIIIVKECESKSTVVDETIEYKITITNRGNTEVFNFILSEQLPPELEFKQGTIVIDGNSDYLADIISGVEVGVIRPKTYCTVNFKAKVIETPDNKIVTTKAIASFEFIVDPAKPARQEIKESNLHAINVEIAELFIEKTADKKFVVLGDLIDYSIMVESLGTISATDIMVIDKLPGQIEFVRNSLMVNGQRVNAIDISRGINIGNLPPYKKTLIKYKAKVSRTNTGCVIENEAYAIFNYKSAGGLRENTKFTKMVSVKINTASPTFKELSQEGILFVPSPKVAIQEVDIINAEVEILDYHVIKAMKGISVENRRATGYKLIVNGLLMQSLEYTACDALQSVHSSKFERKFSTFINLPQDYEEGSHIAVDCKIEDIFYYKLTDREVFSNIMVFIEANNIC